MMKKIIILVTTFILAYYVKESLTLIDPFNRPQVYIDHLFEIPLVIAATILIASMFAVYKLLSKDEGSLKNWIISLLIVIFLSVFAKYLYANILPVTNDEGAYLFDSLLISQGSSPFYYSFARSPSLIYPLSVFIKSFGPSLLVGRWFSIVASILIAIFFFLIGKLYKNYKFGFLSASLFMCFSSLVYDTVYIQTQTITYFFVVSSFYFLLRYLKADSKRLIVTSYVLLAFGVLARETVIFYLPMWVACTFLPVSIKTFKAKINASLVGISAFLITFVGTWSLLGSSFGFEKIINNFIALANMRGSAQDYFTSINYKVGLFRQNTGYILSLVMLFLLSLGGFLIARFNKYKNYILLIFSIVFIFLLKGIPNTLLLGGIEDYYLFFVCLTGLFVFSSLIYLSGIKAAHSKEKSPLLYFSLLFLVPFLFYVFYYSNFQTEYWMEFITPSVLLIAYMLTKYVDQLDRTSKSWLLLSMSVILTINLFSAILVTQRPQRGTYPILNLIEITDFLNKNHPNREIFTGAVIIPFLSGNKLSLNISHPAIYCNCTPISDKVIYTLFPKEDEIVKYLDNNNVQVVLVEKITKDVYFAHRRLLFDYVKRNYSLVKTIGNENPIEVFARNNQK